MARIARTLVLVTATTALAVGVAAAPAVAADKAPVKISGTVNNEGVGKVKHGAVSIEADNFSFDKTFLKAKPGSVAVTVENTGTAPHTFTIDAQSIDVQLAPGDQKTVTVKVAAGEPVAFYCKFHKASGMQGALFTTKSTAARSSGSSSGGSSYGY